MSKRSLTWSEEKYKRYLAEGRGKGVGKDYLPWLTVQDFPSEGRISRVHGITTDRVQHFFSDLETHCFYIFDWADEIIDIREQYPLLEYDELLTMATELGIKYPCDNDTDYPVILTTDFLLTVKTSKGTSLIARTVKPFSNLDKKRIIEKFELERRYWLKRSVDWGIITEKDIPTEVVKNIQWVHPFYKFEISNLSAGDFSLLCLQLKQRLKTDSNNSISKLCIKFDYDFNLQPGVSLSLFRHLVARKEISFDVIKKLDLNIKLENYGSVIGEG